VCTSERIRMLTGNLCVRRSVDPVGPVCPTPPETTTPKPSARSEGEPAARAAVGCWRGLAAAVTTTRKKKTTEADVRAPGHLRHPPSPALRSIASSSPPRLELGTSGSNSGTSGSSGLPSGKAFIFSPRRGGRRRRRGAATAAPSEAVCQQEGRPRAVGAGRLVLPVAGGERINASPARSSRRRR
jgi:hypothetical protein